jgi:ectoine hydroxylase-related dioxygenase (phytanoyl-CoA dioxygenase family)
VRPQTDRASSVPLGPDFQIDAGRAGADLDPDAVAAYRRDGVVCLRGVLGNEFLDLSARGIARNLERPGPHFKDYSTAGPPKSYATDLWVWRSFPEFERVLFDSPLAAIAGRLMGAERTVLYMDNWVIRRADAVDRAPWHQDLPYFEVDGEMCVAWVPLEPVAADSGITFVRGSHLWERMFMPLDFGTHCPKAPPRGPYERTPDFDREPGRYDFVTWEMAPGDCLMFSGLTVHGTSARGEAGTSRKTIRRWTIRLVDGDAVYRPRGPWTDETAVVLAQEGLAVGQPLVCDLLPVLWERPSGVA